MHSNVKFWDGAAKKYALRPIPDESIYAKKLAITRQYLNPQSKVLEFGCGTGSTALEHAKDAQEIVAYDFSNEMIQIANNKKKQCGTAENVSFKVAAIEEINFGDEQYDVVLGHSILHLTFNNEETLKRIFKGLKKGGVFISGSACLGEANPLLRWVIKVAQFIGKAPALNYFTADSLIDLHQASSFEIERRWDYKKGEVYIVAKKPEKVTITESQ